MGKVKEWKNWSGSLKFVPGEVSEPESEEELVALVKRARTAHKKIRVVGAGHSSSPLVRTEDTLLSLKHFKGVEMLDLDKKQATVLAGMSVHEAGKELFRYGLAMHNTGDVDVQTLAGAIGTGTHGTGKELQNLSSMLIGVRLLTGTGEILDLSEDKDREIFRALRVSLGTCGIFLKMRLQLQEHFRLQRKEYCVRIDDCMKDLERLQENNRNFDFYWYPRSDLVKIRIMNKEGGRTPDISYGTLTRDRVGDSHEILPRTRHLKFDELEYALPAEKAPACFQEVREVVKAVYRKNVAWRILYRTVKADDVFLSPAFRRETVTISIHHNAGLPFQDFFNGIEPIFRKYGGRPHWGKKHSLRAKELQDLYPEWNTFQHYRKKLDPDGIFLTPYMNELLNSEV